jgi:fibronectin type 3 domain-containing protein
MYFKAAPGGSASATQTLTLTNNGTQPLAIPADGLVIAGAGATQYLLVNDPPVPTTIAPGGSLAIQIAYLPPKGTAAGINSATVQIKTNDANNALILVNLFGLATSASVATLPAPGGITATQGASGVTLSWTAQTASNLAGYNVYSSTSASGPFTKLNVTGLLPAADVNFTDTTASSSGTVYYRVTAVDTSNNESQPGSISVSASGQVFAPTGLTAAGSNSGVALTWNAQGAAAGYNVYRSTSPVNGFALLNTSGLATSASYNDSTAIGGVVYYYRVTAVDGQGSESAYALANAPGGPGAPAVPPAAPTGLSAAPAVGGIALSWTAQAGVSGFNVYVSKSANGTYTLLNTSGPLSASATGYTDTTASAGATTYYAVTAVDASDDESDAAAASAAMPAAPAAPTGLTAKGSSAGISLTWKAVSNAAGYNVYRSGSANGSFTLLNSGLVAGTSFADANAPVGVTSYYRVTAVSNLGTASAFATASAAVPTPIPAPVAPTGFTATGITGGGVSLNWNANTESDLAGYKVYRSTSAGGTFTLLNTGGLLTATSYADSTASAGANWYYQVVAVDTQGRTSPAAPANASVATIAPAAPAGLRAAIYPNAITLSWNANTESDLAGYQVFRATSANGPFIQISPGVVQTATSFIDTGAAIAAPSYYKVIAVNVHGQVSSAATVSATRPATAPTAPTGLTAVASVKSITLSWNANGESNLAGYEVLRATSANGPYTQVNAGVQRGTTFVDTTAPAGVVSYYKVVAVNQSSMASSATTISSQRLPAKTPPATPAGFSAAGAIAGVTLTWNAATGAAADNVAGYYVYRSYSLHGVYHKLNAKPLSAGTFSFIDTTATVKVRVYYKLVAVSPVGVSSGAAMANTIRPPKPKVKKVAGKR